MFACIGSLSARRAWIEILLTLCRFLPCRVALRKESVDRNLRRHKKTGKVVKSLSARRAWIEMQ